MSQPPVPPHLLFFFVLSIRVINAVSVRTFFQPDEYFQALEPAWRMVFGEGWLTWVCLQPPKCKSWKANLSLRNGEKSFGV